MLLIFILAFIFIVVLIFKVVFINITTNANINIHTNFLIIACQEKKERGRQEEGTPFLVSSFPGKKKGRRT